MKAGTARLGGWCTRRGDALRSGPFDGLMGVGVPMHSASARMEL